MCVSVVVYFMWSLVIVGSYLYYVVEHDVDIEVAPVGSSVDLSACVAGEIGSDHHCDSVLCVV